MEQSPDICGQGDTVREQGHGWNPRALAAEGLDFGVQDLGFSVHALEFRFQGLGFRMQALEFMI